MQSNGIFHRPPSSSGPWAREPVNSSCFFFFLRLAVYNNNNAIMISDLRVVRIAACRPAATNGGRTATGPRNAGQTVRRVSVIPTTDY